VASISRRYSGSRWQNSAYDDTGSHMTAVVTRRFRRCDEREAEMPAFV
jgi:hypothetical protein